MNLFLFINEKLWFKRIWWLYRPALVEYCEQLVLPIDRYILGASQHTNVPETTHMTWKFKVVFKICEKYRAINSMWRNLTSLFIKVIPYITLLNVWPFCTPNHLRTWWLRWELRIVTRSYCPKSYNHIYHIQLWLLILCLSLQGFKSKTIMISVRLLLPSPCHQISKSYHITDLHPILIIDWLLSWHNW